MAPLIGKHPDVTPGGGFPAGVAFTPVPSPLLGELLERLDNVDELRIVLRAIWLLSKKPASARFATTEELCGDSTVAVMLGAYGDELAVKVAKGLDAATGKGIFLRIEGEGGSAFALNTEPMRRQRDQGNLRPAAHRSEPVAAPKFDVGSDAVAAAYEENIGIITPVVGEKLRDLLNNYEEKEVLGAIAAAALKGARSMRFIEVVLSSNVGNSRESRGQGHAEQFEADAGEDRERPLEEYLRRIQPRRAS